MRYKLNLVPDTNSRALAHLFRGGSRTKLLVDGYNFGKQYWTWTRPHKNINKLSSPDRNSLRHEVIDLVSNFCRKSNACSATIVFDSRYPNRYAVNDVVDVVYSGGEGSNRADLVIVDSIRSLRVFSAYDHVVVVTDDHDLGCDVYEMDTRLLSVIEFSNLLKRNLAS